MFEASLSDARDAPVQRHPPMVVKQTGPGYPMDKLAPHRPTRCERCTLVVRPQFSWCELPCPRAGTSPLGWQLCVSCGTMRCDPVPVMRKTHTIQPCICEYPGGERAWDAAQADGARRAPRQLTLSEYKALKPH